MRSLTILGDNYYHVYNRGNSKQTLFRDRADYARFLFLVLYQQSPVSLAQTNRFVKNYLKNEDFQVKQDDSIKIIDERFVELINFCLMPNHFHLTVRTVSDDGLSRYMHKLGNAYSQYFNKRYETSGHVFQGTYKVKLVDTDQQLAYLSAYIHRNPDEIVEWRGRSVSYPWSSYHDYRDNRWGRLLLPGEILNTFKSFEEYEAFVEASGAKEDFEAMPF